MKTSYRWLQSYFDKKLPQPEKLAELLTMHAFEIEGLEKVNDDYVIDVDVLPNRAHDCLSHIGIAREIAVITGLAISPQINAPTAVGVRQWSDRTTQINADKLDTILEVEILNKDKCRRYIGLEVNNVKVNPSPDWLVERLEAVGQKSINNIVDAANYVMLSTGQPLHAFDADKLASKKIIVRDARKGEKITLLTGEEIELNEDNLVIADEKDSLAIAGVKGGIKAEVDENTKNIILESANFDPVGIRKTARSLNIHTDSSKRFENEITPEMAEQGMNEVLRLILETAKTSEIEVKQVVDIYPQPVKQWSVKVTVSEVNKVLGTDISKVEIKDIFDRFKFEFTEKDGEFDVEIPNYRLDLKIKEDLIEEIGRIYGYANIKSVLLEKAKPEINKEFYYTTKIRNILINHGFSEVYTYSFVEKGEVEMQNPLASDKKFLRNNLKEGLSKSLELNKHNAPLLGLDEIKIFEIGHVFGKRKTDAEQDAPTAVGVRLRSDRTDPPSPRASEGHSAELIEHLQLGIASEKEVEKTIKMLGEELGAKISAEIKDNIAEINLDELIEHLSNPTADEYKKILDTGYGIQDAVYRTFSLFPFVPRDIAVWVSGSKTDAKELVAIIKKHAGDLLVRDPDLFDKFEKGDKTSYAYHLVFQSHENTLTDEEVNKIMEKIYAEIEKKGWTVR